MLQEKGLVREAHERIQQSRNAQHPRIMSILIPPSALAAPPGSNHLIRQEALRH